MGPHAITTAKYINALARYSMMMSSNASIFRIIGPLWVEFTSHRWIPLTKTSDAELWCLHLSAPEQTVELTIETPVIWDAIALIITSLQYDIRAVKWGYFRCPLYNYGNSRTLM